MQGPQSIQLAILEKKDGFSLIEEAYSYFLAIQIKYIVIAPNMEIHQKYFEYGLVIN